MNGVKFITNIITGKPFYLVLDGYVRGESTKYFHTNKLNVNNEKHYKISKFKKINGTYDASHFRAIEIGAEDFNLMKHTKFVGCNDKIINDRHHFIYRMKNDINNVIFS